MQGEKDFLGRGNMLKHILRIIEIKKPKYLFLENVKGFLSVKFKDVRTYLANSLKELGYFTTEDDDLICSLLNTKDYGIPQNRERVWIFASLDKVPDNFSLTPTPTIESGRVCNFLDPVEELKTSDFLSIEQVNRLKERLSIKSFKVEEPLCLDAYNKKIKVDGICPTLTDPSHCSIYILESRRGEEEVRKLTISEQFRLMGFRDGEVDFANLSYSQLGKRMGNGWDVNLVALILENIFKQLSIIK